MRCISVVVTIYTFRLYWFLCLWDKYGIEDENTIVGFAFF